MIIHMMKTFFTLQEMIQSETAEKYNIDNTPNEIQVGNIKETINDLLDPFRKSWEDWCVINNLGKPGINVTSGFRSKYLNAKVGGSNTSAHLDGYAADLVPVNGKLREFRQFAETYMKGVMFDQCIFENVDDKGIPQWIHLGWKNRNGEQRRQMLIYKNRKYTLI